MNPENSKTSKTHKFVLTLTDRIDIQRSDKNIIKKVTANLADLSFILATFQMCCINLFSSFNYEKFKVHVLK